LSPRCCKHEVTLADPAQISRKNGSVFCWQGKTAGQGELLELEDELASEAKFVSAGKIESTVRAFFVEYSGSGKELSRQDMLRLGALASHSVSSLVCQAFLWSTMQWPP
jgi:hypothetical protein